VAIQAVTGLFAYDDISIEGPLFNLVSVKTADLLTKLHHINFNLIILFAALHIATILVYRFFKNTNFIKAMVTGSADWPLSQQPIPHDANLKSPLLAAGIWAGGYILIQIIFKVIGS
jgi:hypothetical protein